MNPTQIPPYMQPGSKGIAVFLLATFLIATGHGDTLNVGETGEEKDDYEYDDAVVAAVKALQQTLNVRHPDSRQLDTDGNFGPASRSACKAVYGFDFETLWQRVAGFSSFVQADGTTMTLYSK